MKNKFLTLCFTCVLCVEGFADDSSLNYLIKAAQDKKINNDLPDKEFLEDFINNYKKNKSLYSKEINQYHDLTRNADDRLLLFFHKGTKLEDSALNVAKVEKYDDKIEQFLKILDNKKIKLQSGDLFLWSQKNINALNFRKWTKSRYSNCNLLYIKERKIYFINIDDKNGFTIFNIKDAMQYLIGFPIEFSLLRYKGHINNEEIEYLIDTLNSNSKKIFFDNKFRLNDSYKKNDINKLLLKPVFLYDAELIYLFYNSLIPGDRVEKMIYNKLPLENMQNDISSFFILLFKNRHLYVSPQSIINSGLFENIFSCDKDSFK